MYYNNNKNNGLFGIAAEAGSIQWIVNRKHKL